MPAERGRITATINADGSSVEIEVKGVKGAKCLALTKAMEESVGEVTDRRLTQEYHQNARTEGHQSVSS